MLVLTRKPEQTVKMTIQPSPVPIEIEVTVLEINGQSMKVGINAPQTVHIIRGEVVGRGPTPRNQNQHHGE